MGVWIETDTPTEWGLADSVTPCVGVWIETSSVLQINVKVGSHPAWVCGLKLKCVDISDPWFCHTLRGCVD